MRALSDRLRDLFRDRPDRRSRRDYATEIRTHVSDPVMGDGWTTESALDGLPRVHYTVERIGGRPLHITLEYRFQSSREGGVRWSVGEFMGRGSTLADVLATLAPADRDPFADVLRTARGEWRQVAIEAHGEMQEILVCVVQSKEQTDALTRAWVRFDTAIDAFALIVTALEKLAPEETS